jgi:hypothetical protein
MVWSISLSSPASIFWVERGIEYGGRHTAGAMRSALARLME